MRRPKRPVLGPRDWEHDESGLRLDLPAGFEVRTDLAPIAVAVVETAPDPDFDFAANVSLVLETIEPGTDLDGYAEAAWAANEARLVLPRLLDVEQTTLSGLPCVRSLALHVVDGRTAVTMEQRLLVHDGLGWAFTSTCADDAWPSFSDGPGRQIVDGIRLRGTA